MRVVIDTNVVVSRLLSPTGTPASIFERWRSGAFELLVSEPILSEYDRVLRYETIRARHGLTMEEIDAATQGFFEFGVLVETTEKLQIMQDDPEDNKFLECAIAGEATYIVSGDAHLLALRNYRGIEILTPSVFLAALEQG